MKLRRTGDGGGIQFALTALTATLPLSQSRRQEQLQNSSTASLVWLAKRRAPAFSF